MRKQLVVTFCLLLVFVTMVFFLYWLKGALPGQWGTGSRWQYAQRLVFVLFPLSVMCLLRRAPSLYGFSLSKMPREVAVGLAIVMWLILVTFMSAAFLSSFAVAWRSMNLGAPVVLFALATGFSEECLFRGFYQGELNRVFPRKFALGQTRFGWSVFITAGIFGLAHMFAQFNPLESRFNLILLPFVYTAFHGIIDGIAREYFGGIVSVALVHGGWNLAYGLYPASWESRAAAIIAYVLACIFFVNLMQKERTPLQGRNIAEPEH